MHELTATQNILSIALGEAAKVGARRIVRINVRNGVWSTFDPECLRFYLGILAKGTAAEGAELSVETVTLRYACEECGTEYGPGTGSPVCPKCGSASGRLIAGRDICVDSIEVVDEDTGGSENPGGE